jgi:suppressor of ftsI
MRPRMLGLVVLVLIAVVVAAVWLLTKDDKGEATVAAIGPAPLKGGLAFAEPPSLRSSGGRLSGTIVAKNGTVDVSGIRVAGTQTFGIAGQRRGLLGPTLRVAPGDLVDLVLDNRLTQYGPIPAGTATSTTTTGHDPMGGECAHDTTIPVGHQQPTNFHFHGFHVTPRNHTSGNVTYYGDNVLACLRGGRSHIRFRIPKDHDQGTFWYHAHMHGLTDDQVYRGLAGMIVIGDSRRYLPSRFAHIRSRILSFKDIQTVAAGGRQTIPGDHDWAHQTHRTVNGRVNPVLTMRPGETQLWRLANTSSALWYRVALMDGVRRDAYSVIAIDGNPMALPERKTQLVIAPGHRFDILVRAPRSGRRILKTLPFNQGRLIFGEDVLATIDVEGAPARAIASLHEHGTLPAFPRRRGPTRTWKFSVVGDTPDFLINDKKFDPDRVDARPRLGTTERWILTNTSSEWHPFHVHQDDFRVIAINGRRVVRRGDQDIVGIPPQVDGKPGRVVIDMPFQQYSGNFVLHCHILDHEDAGMMARIDVRE